MITALLALHLLGLMMGAGGGFGSTLVMGAAAKRPPAEAGVLRSVGPLLARFAAAGLVLMWVTGVALVFVRYGGFSALPAMFWVKMVFVTTLTLAVGVIEMTYAQIKRGNAAAAQRLAMLGPIAGLSSLLSMTFAVITFQ